jgi:hypothetical protein
VHARRAAGSLDRLIRYQLTIYELSLAKDLADFAFAVTPIDQTLVHDLEGFSVSVKVHLDRSIQSSGTHQNER